MIPRGSAGKNKKRTSPKQGHICIQKKVKFYCHLVVKMRNSPKSPHGLSAIKSRIFMKVAGRGKICMDCTEMNSQPCGIDFMEYQFHLAVQSIWISRIYTWSCLSGYPGYKRIHICILHEDDPPCHYHPGCLKS